MKAKRVVVVGGGISGLSTAHYLLRRAEVAGIEVEVSLLEGDSRTGGKVWSPKQDGYLVEWGPNGFLSSREDVMRVSSELALGERLLPSNEASEKRYIFSRGALRKLPSSPPSAIASSVLSLGGKLRILREPWTRQHPAGVEESVAHFAERHLGKEALEQLIGPFVTGVYAGDPDEMSLDAALPVMRELEAEGSGSLIRAMIRRGKAKKAAAAAAAADRSGNSPALAADGGAGRAARTEGMTGSTGRLTSYDDGMSVLTDALRDRLGDSVSTGQKVTTVTRTQEAEAPWRVWVEGSGEPHVADAVVLASPAYATASILSELDPALADLVGGIPYAAVNVVCLGYDDPKVQAGLDGFGFLIPFKEERRILGAVWTSSVFPSHAPEGRASIRVMVGGARGRQWTELDDEATLSMVREEVQGTMGIAIDPDFVHIHRHEKAIPQYVMGHMDRLRDIDRRLASGHAGLVLTGNAYRGVSLPDCVRNGAAAAGRVLAHLVASE